MISIELFNGVGINRKEYIMENISKKLKTLADRMDVANPYDRSYIEETGGILLGIQEGWIGVEPARMPGSTAGSGAEDAGLKDGGRERCNAIICHGPGHQSKTRC